jgi:hypothetical protein
MIFYFYVDCHLRVDVYEYDRCKMVTCQKLE